MDFDKIAKFGDVMLVTDENIFAGNVPRVLDTVREVTEVMGENDLFVSTPTQLSFVLMAHIAARAVNKGWKRINFLVFDAREQNYIERQMSLCS